MTGKKAPVKPAPKTKNGETAAVHLIFGEEEYLVSTATRELVDRLCPPVDQAFGLDIIEWRVDTVAEAVAVLGRCLEALKTLGFLAGKKTVWLRDAAFFGETVVGKSEEVKKRVEELVGLIKGGLPPGQTLVVSTLKVDGRSAFFKACQAAGVVREFELPDQSYKLVQQARERAIQAFHRAGLTATEDVLEEFLDKTGTDTRQIVQEVEKLSLYVGDRKQVRVEDIRAIVSPAREAVAWDLADAVGQRNLSLALKVLRQLIFQGENAVGLIIGLENRFRELLLYRECMDRKWLQITGQDPWLKVTWKSAPDIETALSALPKDPRQANPYRAGKLLAQVRQFSKKDLIDGQNLLVATHESLVSGAVPHELQLEFMLIKMLGPEEAVGG